MIYAKCALVAVLGAAAGLLFTVLAELMLFLLSILIDFFHLKSPGLLHNSNGWICATLGTLALAGVAALILKAKTDQLAIGFLAGGLLSIWGVSWLSGALDQGWSLIRRFFS